MSISKEYYAWEAKLCLTKSFFTLSLLRKLQADPSPSKDSANKNDDSLLILKTYQIHVGKQQF